DAADRQVPRAAVLLVAQGVDLVVADDLLDVRVEDELDLRVRPRTVDEDRLRAELVPAVDDVNLRRVPGEEVALLDRGVAAAHHRELLALEERPVAHGAVADPAAPELLLAGDLEVARKAARRDDQRAAAQLVAGLDPDDLGVAVDVDLLHRLEVADLEAELARVLAHLGGKVRAQDGLEPGVVLDKLGVQKLAAQRPAVEQDGLEVHPRGVQTGGQAGGAPADDDDVVLAHAVTGIVTALARIPRTTIAGPAGLAQAELRSEAAARRVADDVVERAADRAGAAFDAVAEADEVLLLLLVPLVHAGRAEVVAVLAGALG